MNTFNTFVNMGYGDLFLKYYPIELQFVDNSWVDNSFATYFKTPNNIYTYDSDRNRFLCYLIDFSCGNMGLNGEDDYSCKIKWESNL